MGRGVVISITGLRVGESVRDTRAASSTNGIGIGADDGSAVVGGAVSGGMVLIDSNMAFLTALCFLSR